MADIDLAHHIPIEAYYLQYVAKAKRRGDQLDGLCPFHEDKNASFTVNINSGLYHCRVGCGSGDVVDFHGKRLGLDRAGAFKDLCETYNLPLAGKSKSKPRTGKKPTPATKSTSSTTPPPSKPPADKKIIPEATLDQFKEISEAAREYATRKRGWSDAVIEKYGIGWDGTKGRERYTIPVRDEDGDLVNIRRYQPGADEFKLISWSTGNKKAGTWVGYGETRLWPLSILTETPPETPIIISEGEPDTLCGLSRGLACITQTAGAGTWMDAFNPLFKGRHVIICYDNDEAGKAGVQKVVKHLPHFARLIESIQWPEWMGEKEDLTDWFVKHGKSVEEFLALPRVVHEKAEDQPVGVDEDPRVLKLNEKHAVIMVGGKCVVLNEVMDPVFHRPDITFSSPSDLKSFYANQKIWLTDARGAGQKALNVAKLWLESTARRQYDGIVFAPGQEQVNGHYNLYRGIQTEPRQGDWSLMSNHIFEVIASRNQEVYNYLIYWLADLFQHPGDDRPGVAIVLRGGQGTGKGTLANQVGLILGNHYLHITSQHQFVGRFNNHLKDALFVFVDEGVWAGDKSAEGALRGMITEDYVMVEPKGRDVYAVKNHVRLLIASNNNWVVPAGIDERRFCVLDVSDSRKQDHGYFKAILEQMDNGGREAMLWDLLNLDITQVNLRVFPVTDGLFRQKLHSMSSTQKWWYQTLSYGFLTGDRTDAWEHAIPTQKLHAAYLEFCRVHNERYPVMCELFIRELGRLTTIFRSRPTLDGQRTYHVRFPSLIECRETFGSKVGMPVCWDIECQE